MHRTLLPLALAAACAPAAAAFPAAPPTSRLVECGTSPFRLSALDGPANQPKGHGPLPEALRSYLPDPYPAPGPMPVHGWRLLRRTAHRAVFGHGRPPHMAVLVFNRHGRRWSWMNWQDRCPLRAVRGGLAASAWRLDPAHPHPGRRARVLHVLVRERNCASGDDTRGRIQRPSIWVNPRRIAVAMYVTPLEGDQFCQGVPETPATVRLPVALGGRKLFDAGFVPSHRRR